ncbi:transglycosylase SLT domain-containing protein [Aquabacterium sp.]|uniref:transglycosylase SLT domain-containing protein n=1 Tax=Aquabacterium sp. TaxID=1872578 RepID=UPI0035ADFFB2
MSIDHRVSKTRLFTLAPAAGAMRRLGLCSTVIGSLVMAGCAAPTPTSNSLVAGSGMRKPQITTASNSVITSAGALSTTLSSRTPSGTYLNTPNVSAPLDDDQRDAVGPITDPLEPDDKLNLNDQSARADLWGRMREGFRMEDLDSPLVADHTRWYADRPDYVLRMTERASRYLYYVVQETEKRQMPTELALLPFVESAFNPHANSIARASGIWQFMPATGKDFELKQNMFRDDRRDVLASTRAALDYLQRLYRQFGDWSLALAAYNWGEGNVQRAINRNLKAGLPTDYLSLNMPAETRNYVPKLHAVRNIVMAPDNYGLKLPTIANHPYFVSVPIQRDMDVPVAAKLAGIPVADFKALNPSMNKPVILAAGTPQLLLPYDNASLFVQNLSQHKGLLATWTAWVVPRTMKVAEAADKVDMSEAELRQINNIPPKMLVKAGSTLLVHRSGELARDVPEDVADNATMALAPDVPPLRKVSLTAGKRDTMASIAKRYKVSVAQLAQWNHTSSSARLRKGDAVVVYVPAGKRVEPTRMAAADDDKSSNKRSSGKAAKADRVKDSKVVAKADTKSSRKATTTKVADRSSDKKSSAKTRVASNAKSSGRTNRVRVASAR